MTDVRIKRPTIDNQAEWMAARREFRRRILERDGYTCFYCGSTRKSDLTLDHKTPLSRGGEHDEQNVVTACLRCNMKKGTLTLEEFRALRVIGAIK